MTAPGPSPFFRVGKASRDVYPFVIAAYKDMQDRVVFGPQIFAEQQTDFLAWIYRDISPGDRVSAFRMGYFRGFSVAARVTPVDVQEAISDRRDGVVVVGIAARSASPGALCECLGLSVLPIAGATANGIYSPGGQDEYEAMADVARQVAASSWDHDWSATALLAKRQCLGIPRYRLSVRSLLRKRLYQGRDTFAALLARPAPGSLTYLIAGEVWVRNTRSDLTVVLDASGPSAAGQTLLYDANFERPSALIALEVRSITMGSSTLSLLVRA
jgi:hypothetical protein